LATTQLPIVTDAPLPVINVLVPQSRQCEKWMVFSMQLLVSEV
jgi:hypothetical protein